MDVSVIIAAAGLGKRLYSETLEIPKCLVEYQKKPILAHQIDYYRQISDDLIVVLSDNELGKLAANWLLDFYQQPTWLKVIFQSQPIGSNDAVKTALTHTKYSKTIISWCDFILTDNQLINNLSNFTENTFYISNINCRFGLQNNKITKINSNPGFIGLYFLTQKPELNSNCEDFIENFLDQEVATQNIDIISLGVIDDLIINNCFSHFANRYFNKLKFYDQVVIKEALTIDAQKLQQQEFNWYQKAADNLKQYLPTVHYAAKENKLILDRIIGTPLCQTQLASEFWQKKLPNLLKTLHFEQIPTRDTDVYSTYLSKPLERLNQVKNTINTWFTENKIINGIDYSDWTFPDPPLDLIPKHFTFIHGDLNFNNMMDQDGNLKLLDPRGYFGKSMFYGDPSYDLAKILYAIDNYHYINENKFILHKLSSGETIFIHHSQPITDDIRAFFDWACQYYQVSKEKLNFILFGIWLSLTGYIINSPRAIIAAYAKALIRSREFLL